MFKTRGVILILVLYFVSGCAHTADRRPSQVEVGNGSVSNEKPILHHETCAILLDGPLGSAGEKFKSQIESKGYKVLDRYDFKPIAYMTFSGLLAQEGYIYKIHLAKEGLVDYSRIRKIPNPFSKENNNDEKLVAMINAIPECETSDSSD